MQTQETLPCTDSSVEQKSRGNLVDEKLDPELYIDVKPDNRGVDALIGQTPLNQDDAVKKLLRRVDLRLMPLLVACYTLQYIDKVALSYANIMGLEKDTNLRGNEFTWLATGYYIAFAIAELPGSTSLLQAFHIVSSHIGKDSLLSCQDARKYVFGMQPGRVRDSSGVYGSLSQLQIVNGCSCRACYCREHNRAEPFADNHEVVHAPRIKQEIRHLVLRLGMWPDHRRARFIRYDKSLCLSSTMCSE